MMASKIEQTIEDIEALIDSCKFKSFSNTHIIVDKEELESLVSELRKRAPEEIKHYQKIISNREAIINEAKQKAKQLIDEASAQTTELISQHEIMLKAYEQADQIVEDAINNAQAILDQATLEANEVKMSAMQYTDSLLSNIEEALGNYIGATNSRYDAMMNSLSEYYNEVISNRQELIASAVDDEGVDVEELLAEDPSAYVTPASKSPKNSNSSSSANGSNDVFLDLDMM